MPRSEQQAGVSASTDGPTLDDQSIDHPVDHETAVLVDWSLRTGAGAPYVGDDELITVGLAGDDPEAVVSNHLRPLPEEREVVVSAVGPLQASMVEDVPLSLGMPRCENVTGVPRSQ